MQLIDGQPVYAATDLVGFLACSPSARAGAGGARRARREAHPQRPVDRARREARRRARAALPRGAGARAGASSRSRRTARRSRRWAPARHRRATRRRARAAETSARCAAGADVIYQATFFDGRWRGHADFLLRAIEREPKRARRHGRTRSRTRSSRATQGARDPPDLLVRRAADADPGPEPERPARRPRRRERPSDSASRRGLHGLLPPGQGGVRGRRRVPGEVRRARLPAVGTYPDRSSTATSVAGSSTARRGVARDDDLSLVAGVATASGRAQGARRPTRRGPRRPRRCRSTRGSRASAPRRWSGSASRRASRSRARTSGGSMGAPAARARRRGQRPCRTAASWCCRSPAPSDLFFDIEGDPFALDDGVEYLFGVLEPGLPETDPRGRTRGRPCVFHEIWSRDDGGQVTWAAEKAAFERLVDLLIARLDADPALHVYHYAAYERTALGPAGAAPRDARGGGRSAAPRRRPRRPVPGRPAGHPGERRELLDQAPRAAVRLDARGRAEAPAEASSRSRRGSSGRGDGDRSARRSSTGSPATTATTSSSNWRLRDWLEERRLDLRRAGGPAAAPGARRRRRAAELGTGDREVRGPVGRGSRRRPGDRERATDPRSGRVAPRPAARPGTGARTRRSGGATSSSADDRRGAHRASASRRRPRARPTRAGRSRSPLTLSVPVQDHGSARSATITRPAAGKGAGDGRRDRRIERTITLQRGPKFDGAPLPQVARPR